MQQAYEITGTIIASDDLQYERMWVIEDKIVLSATQAQRQIVGKSVTRLHGYVLPGLVDVHCHIGLSAEGTALDKESTWQQVVKDKNSGVLAVRDLGTVGDTSWVQAERDSVRLIRCGRHIARPYRYLRNIAVEIDDPHKIPEEVAYQAQRSDGWVKIVADWIDRSQGADSDLRPLWDKDVLVDAMAAAHENGAKVAVHAFAHEGIDDLIEAGVDDIEHATGIDTDQIAECKARQIAITPTALQVENFADIAAMAVKYPVYREHMLRLYANRQKQILAIANSGAPIIMGSDSGSTIMHGSLPEEVMLCVQYGVEASQAIAAASYAARAYLGLPGISEGADADLVIYAQDPRKHVEELLNPKHVLGVENRHIRG